MEKAEVYELPAPTSQTARKRTGPPRWWFITLPIIFLLSFFRDDIYEWIVKEPGHEHGLLQPACHQLDPMFPSSESDKLDETYKHISSDSFKKHTIERMSGAVQIPTQSFDDLGPIGEDSRWDIMYSFADYLEKTFPLMQKHMGPEMVNTHGLVYTYKGSNEDLKPLLLMAHQDVVPVPNETVSAWTHPPFSGYYDGKFIWGRGSSDCKNQLIAIMETMELFLSAGFKPKRTIVLSFGFDEEVSGGQGAGTLAPFIHDRYGDDGLAAIVDEGAGFEEAWGSVFAVPGTGEKGKTDVEITVRYPGGHSSIPTDHTGIGILSEIITKIEGEQYPIRLVDNNPYFGELQCGAEHAPDFPPKLKKLLHARDSLTSANTCAKDPLALEAAKQGKMAQYLMQTSQAATVIRGGVKVNALPERTTVSVNHRVNYGSRPEDVWHRLTELAKPIAEKYNLTLYAFDDKEETPLSISLRSDTQTLRPAPVTPTTLTTKDGKKTPYAILAGTTRAVYGKDIIVSPGMTTGNTDTRFYWPLTRHIFRFGPGWDPEVGGGLGNIHTVDEHVSVEAHVGMVRWFWSFVRNMDEAELE